MQTSFHVALSLIVTLGFALPNTYGQPPSPAGLGGGGSSVPTPSDLSPTIPSPSDLSPTIPTPSDLSPVIPSPSNVLIPSPKSLVPSPNPAPKDLFTPAPTVLINPAPTFHPAPDFHPAPQVILRPTPSPNNPDEPTDTVPAGYEVPAPEESKYFFCETKLYCYDCDQTPLNQLMQEYVNDKWNDTYCDNGESTVYNLNCERFKYDSDACATTTTRVTRQVYLNHDDGSGSITASPDSGSGSGANGGLATGGLSSASMTAIIVCLAVAVVGGITVVVFYAIKKNKEKEYADFQV